MKKLLSAIAVSVGALMATSAMAAPHNHHDNRYEQKHHQPAKHWNNGKNDNRYDRGYKNAKPVNPGRDWRRGQVLPREYSSSRYIVNHKDHRKLTKPGRNQNWLKINGDYVLVDQRNGRILSIVG